jgi:hypothetical protein
MTETVTLNFGSGRFGCLGRGVATMELNKAVVEVSLHCQLRRNRMLTFLLQTLLRFNLQPCSLAKPFNQKVIGFTVHTDMNFIVTERKTTEQQATEAQALGVAEYDAGALPGSYDS